ncbi:MAG TPA: SH3 domain-containing protein [Candidatus Enterenecus stercoripullorum]|nr:SH3 domain-containing protein [Candidatus Enterenecus stercoripullorum]
MNSKRNVVKAIVAAGLTVALTSGIALASIGTGTVTASTLRLRSEGTTQSATLAYAPRSAQVTILSAVSENWYKVTYNGVEGYMSAEWLDVDLSGPDGSASNEVVEPRQAVVTDGPLNVRAGAGTSYDRVGTLQKGDIVTVTDQSTEGWYGVTCGDIDGYVSSEYISFDLDAVEDEAPETGADNSVDAEPQQGVVTADVLNVRSGAGTSYDRVGVLKKGNVVTVTDQSVEGWYGVTCGDVSGYVSSEYISFDLDAVEDEGDSAPSQPKQGRVSTSVLNVRSGAGTSYDRVGTLRLGAVVTITDESVSGWYGISSGSLEGYVSAEYITIVDGSSSSGSSSVGDAAAALAASLVGKPYVYGAAGPNGFDCSGLMYYIYKQLGYSIARGSSSQYYQSGYFVSTSEMQPGDLVYFFDPKFDGSGGTLPTTHVGIYVGNNQFIHASTTSYRVQYDPLFGGYYGPYVVGVKRIA